MFALPREVDIGGYAHFIKRSVFWKRGGEECENTPELLSFEVATGVKMAEELGASRHRLGVDGRCSIRAQVEDIIIIVLVKKCNRSPSLLTQHRLSHLLSPHPLTHSLTSCMIQRSA